MTWSALTALVATSAGAFTQVANTGTKLGTPMGHEWLTGTAGHEIIDQTGIPPGDARSQPLSNGQPFPTAKLLKLQPQWLDAARSPLPQAFSPAGSSLAVNSAIIGVRWVDIGGFNVVNNLPRRTTAGSFVTGVVAGLEATVEGNMPGAKTTIQDGILVPDCFDAVVQLPDDVQQDHFLRRSTDVGTPGALTAMQRAVQSFQNYFVTAAMAEARMVKVWDGGLQTYETTVDLRYFLFGRALHVLQDSFSPEHADRDAKNGFKTLVGIRSYLCTMESDMHDHLTIRDVVDSSSYPSNGDIIWMSAGDMSNANVKPNALAALEASKDAWQRFIQTVNTPVAQRAAVARKHAQALAATWLSFDKMTVTNFYTGHTRVGFISGSDDQASCQQDAYGQPGDGQPRVRADRAACLNNIYTGPTPQPNVTFDPQLRLSYQWYWLNSQWLTQPTQQPPSPNTANTPNMSFPGY
jgi:hypothetical protein